MSDPAEAFLRSLFGGGLSDIPISIIHEPSGLGAGGLGGAGRGFTFTSRGLGGLGTGVRQQQSAQNLSRSSGSAAAPGSIYEGGVPPEMWIQMQQRRDPLGDLPASPSTATVDAAALREEGNRATRTGNLEAAIQYYTRSMAADPRDARTYTNRSLVYFRQGNYRASADDAEEAIRADPSFYKGYYRKGLALEKLNEFSEALEAFQKARERCPEEEKAAIDVCIAKCKSRIVRTPATPLIAESPQRPPSTATAFPTAPVRAMTLGDYERIAQLTESVSAKRGLLVAHDAHEEADKSHVERIQRAEEVKQLFTLATSSQLSQQSKEAEAKQTALRQALKKQSRSDYYKAKHERDTAYESMWKTAEEVKGAIQKLTSIAAAEAQPAKSEYVSPTLSASPTSFPSPSQQRNSPLPESEPVGATGLQSLLSQRDAISEKVRQIKKHTAATDAAAQAYLSALEEEAEATRELEALLSNSKNVHAELAERGDQAGHFMARELSGSRLKDLHGILQSAEHIMADEHAFQTSLVKGNMLLDEEAELERQRLLLERQRIRINAELEWAKVQDEPSQRIHQMSEHLKQVRENIDAANRKQKEVQSQILELVERDHPELAWKSMSSGSRILRLVKGSGLWLNLSFTDFQIVSTISSTVNSKVYQALYRGEHVAVKEVSVDDETMRVRFQREVDIVAACNHPNIIRLKGVFFDGPFAYVVLPFFTKGSLKNLIAKKEPLSWVAVQDIFRQVATGLSYLHERGIVHADIKPSNILLSSDGRPVISDFGIAKRRGEFGELTDLTLTQTQTQTQSSRAAGTSGYMAPEQLSAADNSQTTSKSDMWALGVALYELAANNAACYDSSLGAPPQPVLLPGQERIEISPKRVGGDEKLADAISSLFFSDRDKRPSAHELLAHPYFSTTTHAAERTASNAALAKSDERLEALRSYLHAVRAGSRSMLISVTRHHMVESLQSTLLRFSEEDLMANIIVVFQGEAGVDQGALTSEMLNLFYEQLIKDKRALVSSEDGNENAAAVGSPMSPGSQAGGGGGGAAPSFSTFLFSNAHYLPADDSKHIPTELFELLGRVLLKSIIENRPLPMQLNSALLKYLTGTTVSLADLEEYDQPFAESLVRLRLLSEENIRLADLNFGDFTAEFLATRCDGKYTPEVVVTTENVRHYVDLRVEFELIEKRKQALEAIKKGFTSCASLNPHLSLLTSSDLQLLLSGVQHISAEIINDALEFHGFPSSSRTPKYLKEVISDMSQNNRRRFLQLCTTSAALPANGALKKIKVIRAGDPQRLPVGHGCVSQLDLPDYNDKTVLRDKLEVSLTHVSDGFQIV